MRFLLAILLLLLAAPASAQQGQGLSKALVVSSCGTQAWPSGPLTNLTMNPQGQLCLIGIAPGGFCAQASQYLSRTTGGNEGGNAANIAALICGLVSDGIITGTLAGARTCGVYLDALYIFAQQNVTDAKLNLCGTSYGITQDGSTFTSYRGFQGFTTGLNSGFNAATATSPNFSLNSASMGVWSNGPSAATEALFGSQVNYTGILAYLGPFYVYMNGLGNPAAGSSTTKFYGAEILSPRVYLYFDGVTVASVAGAPLGLDNNPVVFGAFDTSGSYVSTDMLTAGYISGGLGGTLNLALYNRLRTYMTAVGLP